MLGKAQEKKNRNELDVLSTLIMDGLFGIQHFLGSDRVIDV